MKDDATKPRPLTPDQQHQLERLRALPDDEIDTVDIPEAPAENWRYARRGALYRPLKQSVTIRLDADVLQWFRDHAEGRGYQTEINAVLRRHVAKAASGGD
jgi:uncharacterized protein (DUF4415 family)